MIQPRKVRIDPIGCLQQSTALLGDQYWLFLAIIIVAMLIAGAVPVILVGPMYVGMGLCLVARARAERMDFNQLFQGFEHFVPGLVAILLHIVLAVVIMLPTLVVGIVGMVMMGAGAEQENPALLIVGGLLMFFGFLIYMLAAVLTYIVAQFATLLIAEHKLTDGVQAFKLALSGVIKNFGGLLALSILGQLLIGVGFLLCIIPGILMAPIPIAAQFLAYQKIFAHSGPGDVARPLEAKPVF